MQKSLGAYFFINYSVSNCYLASSLQKLSKRVPLICYNPAKINERCERGVGIDTKFLIWAMGNRPLSGVRPVEQVQPGAGMGLIGGRELELSFGMLNLKCQLHTKMEIQLLLGDMEVQGTILG